MADIAAPPLLQPPPKDVTDTKAVKQWMENIYRFLYAKTITDNQALNNLSGSIDSNGDGITSLEEFITSINESIDDLNTSIDTLEDTVLLTHLSSQTFSGSASVDFTDLLTTAYKSYQVVIDYLFPSSAGEVLMHFETASGTDTTATHYITVSSTITIGISISGGVSLGTTANTGMAGVINILNPNSTTAYRWASGKGVRSVNATTTTAIQVSGHYITTGEALTGFTLAAEVGNLSGQVSLYGVK